MASEWQIVGPAPQQQSSSEWELVSDSAPQTQQQSSTGMGRNLADWLVSAANSGLLGFGDEAAAGVRSVLPGFGSYEQELGAIRGGMKDYAEQHPVADASAKVLGAVSLPGGLAKQGTTVGAKIAKAAAEGAGYGAAYGFGEGEGSATNRLKNAASGGAVSGLFGGGLNAFGQGAKAFSPRLTKSGKAQRRSSLGASYGDYKKGTAQLSRIDLPEDSLELETFTKQAIDELLESGKLGSSRNPQELRTITLRAQKELGETVTDILDNKEAQGIRIAPDFESARQFIKQGNVPAEKAKDYLKRIENIESEIVHEGGGSLKYLQAQKVAYGKSYNPDDAVLHEFNRRIYHDLQRSIEKVAPEVKPINKELSKYKVLDEMLNRSIARDEGAKVSNKLISSWKTTGGFGAPLIAGTAAGAPGLGVAAWGAGLALGNSRGQELSGRGLLALGRAASKGGEKIQNASPLAARLLAANFGESSGAPQSTPQQQQGLLGVGTGSSQGLSSQSQPRTLVGQEAQERWKAYGAPAEMTASPLRLEKGQQGRKDHPPKSPRPQELPVGGGQYSASQSSSNPPKINSNTMSILLDAVKQVESGGNTKAVSPAGAKGAYQFTDATAQDYGLKDPFNESEARKAAQSKILADLEYFGGDLELALAAYNAGRGRISGLLRKVNGKTIDDIAHLLPRETIQYLPKIEKEFRRLMGNGTA